MRNKKIILLTNSFPYGFGEQFLETEIKFLAKKYNEVIIYPWSQEGPKRAVPINVKVERFKKNESFKVRKLFLSNILIFLRMLKYEWKNRKLYMIKGYKYHFNNFLGDLNTATLFTKLLENKYSPQDIVYSYWFGPWGNVMSFVNNLSKNKWQFIARVHGYDYDVTRREDGLIPYRKYQLSRVAKIVSVSQFAINRIQSEYPNFDRIVLSRLGVCDNGKNPKKDSDEPLNIISCSSFIPLKRVHLIIELLHHFNQKVKWTHFGDGELKNRIYKLADELPANISVDFRGHVSNETVIDFYKTEHVDLFINVSELEGIPVSIMEAISFGIPVVGCSVCGVPEIVLEQTGILLNKNFDVTEAAEEIMKFINRSDNEMKAFRENVKLFWKDNFNADKNYLNFVTDYLNYDE